MPASSSARSRSFPAGPTNGWPWRSSSLPGCSPTSINCARSGPSPKTVCVACFHRSQLRQLFAAARTLVSDRVGREAEGILLALLLPAMPRPLWKGAISFGLVSIPVELHTAVRDHRPHFRMLHATDKSPVRFERVCIREGEPVAWQDLVKGYEYEKGHFVVVTKEDFQAAAVEKTRTVDILDFVKAEEIDDRFFETPYYLVPVKSGERAYALLRSAIRESGRIGIAKFILRDAQHLAAVEVIQDAIVLSVMRFHDELVDEQQFTFPPAKEIRPQELQMAKALVESLAAEWDPGKYTDQYRE